MSGLVKPVAWTPRAERTWVSGLPRTPDAQLVVKRTTDVVEYERCAVCDFPWPIEKDPEHHVSRIASDFRCKDCRDDEQHIARLWWPADEPERPLDLHGIFCGCQRCHHAWHVLDLPRFDLPTLL